MPILDSDFESLAGLTNKDPVTAMNEWCLAFLKEIANGGILLGSKDIETMERSAGADVSCAKDVVNIVLSAKGKEDGQLTVRVQIDPAWQLAVEENAESQGWTVEEMLTNLVNWCLGNGMGYALTPSQGACIPLDENDYKSLSEFCGKKDFTSKDLLASIRKLQK